MCKSTELLQRNLFESILSPNGDKGREFGKNHNLIVSVWEDQFVVVVLEMFSISLAYPIN